MSLAYRVVFSHGNIQYTVLDTIVGLSHMLWRYIPVKIVMHQRLSKYTPNPIQITKPQTPFPIYL
jgi:hypothetical protein